MKYQKAEGEIGSSHPIKRDRGRNNQESSQYAGAYAKAPPSKGYKMATIQENETKKRRTDPQGSKTRDVAHREDALAKLTNRIKSSTRKAGETIVSEIPTDLRREKYTEDMEEEGYATNEEIFKNQPKGKAISVENGIIKRAWWGAR